MPSLLTITPLGRGSDSKQEEKISEAVDKQKNICRLKRPQGHMDRMFLAYHLSNLPRK